MSYHNLWLIGKSQENCLDQVLLFVLLRYALCEIARVKTRMFGTNETAACWILVANRFVVIVMRQCEEKLRASALVS